MINMADDLMVPVELGHARLVLGRLKNARYFEVPATGAGHSGFRGAIAKWGPEMRAFLENLP
jgi:hypothetical protein